LSKYSFGRNKSLYDIVIYNIKVEMLNMNQKSDDVRWLVIKAMLDEFPALREKVKDYLKGKD